MSMQETAGFIKVTEKPVDNLTSEQKAQLNRKGNIFFNEGNIESAKRIFLATGYSDGLSRVGDKYYEEGKQLEALKLYYLAHNKRKTEPLFEAVSQLLKIFIEKEV